MKVKAVAAVVVQLYHSLNIYVVLVGVEVWSSGDMITTENDFEALDHFRFYRRDRINPHHHNDIAQLITQDRSSISSVCF